MWFLMKAALSSGMPAPIENEIADATDACLQPAVASPAGRERCQHQGTHSRQCKHEAWPAAFCILCTPGA